MSLRMVHKANPGAVYEAANDEQADVLRKSGWKSESAVKATRTRKRAARKSETAEATPAPAPAPTDESE